MWEILQFRRSLTVPPLPGLLLWLSVNWRHLLPNAQAFAGPPRCLGRHPLPLQPPFVQDGARDLQQVSALNQFLVAIACKNSQELFLQQ